MFYLASKYGVAVEFLKIDFSDDVSIYDEIEKFLDGKDIGVLMNNVGLASPLVDFLDIPNLSEHISRITRINIISVLKV